MPSKKSVTPISQTGTIDFLKDDIREGIGEIQLHTIDHVKIAKTCPLFKYYRVIMVHTVDQKITSKVVVKPMHHFNVHQAKSTASVSENGVNYPNLLAPKR